MGALKGEGGEGGKLEKGRPTVTRPAGRHLEGRGGEIAASGTRWCRALAVTDRPAGH